MRFKVVTWHGEHKTAWYVVDTCAPEDEQPATIAGIGAGKGGVYGSYAAAQEDADTLNMGVVII